MGIIIDWVTQIIIFILLAMIIELLLPNSSMKKYINMVVGLLLITIFLQPLFHLFRVDLDSFVDQALPTISMTEEQQNMKNSIEMKKNEIQASQAAYVVEEMAVQMKKQAEEGLIETYGVEIADINLDFENDQVDAEKLQAVNVVVTKQDIGQNHQGPVEEVVIDIGKQQESGEENNETKQIRDYCSEAWQLDEQLITILWEGGV